MHTPSHRNPTAYLDAHGIAHVQMSEQQEGFGAPRRSTLMRGLGISGQAADRLREKMRRADETGDGIEDILREAQRLLRAKGVAYYPGVADAPDAPDGIAFVDRGDPKAETLLYDHRDGRFTVNAWGPAVARQRERFSKNNPDPAKRYRDLQRMAAPGSGASENERAMAQRLLAKMTPPPEERPTPRSGGYAYSPPRRKPEPWQTDPRDSTEIYRNDLSDLNFAKKSIYEHASEPRVRVTLQGFDGTYLRSIFQAFSSMNDLGYAAEVLETWGEDYFKKGGTFEIVIGRVEGEDDITRILRVRGVDVSHLGLVVHTDDFYDPDLAAGYFKQLDKYLSKNLPKYVAAATGAPMPTQFVTNPRRPKKTSTAKRRGARRASDKQWYVTVNYGFGQEVKTYGPTSKAEAERTYDYLNDSLMSPGDTLSIYSGKDLRAAKHARKAVARERKRPDYRWNPSFKSPHAGPSAQRMADALDISLPVAMMLKVKMKTGSSSVENILKVADDLLDGHGVEYIESLTDTMRSREGLSYVNMGDTYDTTLIYDHGKGRFVVSSWGDIVERDAKRFGY